MRLNLFGLGGMVLGLLWVCRAAADPPGSGTADADAIAPLPPEIRPQPEPEIAVRFQQSLAKGIRAARWQALDADLIRQRVPLTAGQAGCGQRPCVQQALRVLPVQRAAAATVSIVGKNYAFALDVYRGTDLIRSNQSRCDICTLTEALESLAQLTERTLRASHEALRQHSPGSDEVVSPRPTQAKQPAGSAPPSPKPPPSLASPGPTAHPAGSERHPAWPLWPSLLAAGVGVVGLAVGIPLLVVDGTATQCRGEPRKDNLNCERIYSTSAGGWAFTSIGLAALATSGVLFYLHRASPRAEHRDRNALKSWHNIAVLPMNRGAWIGASGAF